MDELFEKPEIETKPNSEFRSTIANAINRSEEEPRRGRGRPPKSMGTTQKMDHRQDFKSTPKTQPKFDENSRKAVQLAVALATNASDLLLEKQIVSITKMGCADERTTAELVQQSKWTDTEKAGLESSMIAVCELHGFNLKYLPHLSLGVTLGSYSIRNYLLMKDLRGMVEKINSEKKDATKTQVEKNNGDGG